MYKRMGLRCLALASVWLASACASVAPIDCTTFPSFHSAGVADSRSRAEYRNLLATAQSFPSPDRIALAGAYAALGNYEAAFEMASLPDGSGSREDAQLAIVGFASADGEIDVAQRALTSIDFRRNVARANLALAVALAKAGRLEEAAAADAAARGANPNTVLQYAYHSLLSGELTQRGDYAAALRQAEQIVDEFWPFRVNAMIRVAWSQYQDGDVNSALRTLAGARSLVDRSGESINRFGLEPDFTIVMAELFVLFGDHNSALDLLRSMVNVPRHDSSGRRDFQRVSAILILNKIESETGSAEAATLREEMEQVAVENLVLLDQRLGFGSDHRYYARVELVRLMLNEGKSDWLHSTADGLSRYVQVSLRSAIAHAEASRGNMDRAEEAVMKLDPWRDRCTVLASIYAEIGTPDRYEDSRRNTAVMEREGCHRLSVVFPHALYSELAIEAARSGDRVYACEALGSVQKRDILVRTVGGIATARAESNDFTAAQAVVRWAYSAGNVDGTEASQILSGIVLAASLESDGEDIYPPVLGQTRFYAELQRAAWRYPIWLDDGIWDQ